ncbi:unnamed protein product (macronuclear) [Paramecium tetraurelia]|uniref:Uncharacterized protein n=1 Tax=Paramecium tetraurelia TaxID=5888 RepID=A0CIL7_PARTE|nr:uncharacterized protein GSPATT00007769001 [Paramecium tetraurelia]CAK70634.1 unnamed protein product [Paramecium tetraurelia]|eukprot:XP_001438031.1 hypothetical protein (macronuclear) [Paramecium tetraurelia strain d4-2]
MNKQQQSVSNSLTSIWSKRTSIETIQNEALSPEFENSTQDISKYHFVIGILKPGQKRIGLIAINKNKLSIAGILGIKKIQK